MKNSGETHWVGRHRLHPSQARYFSLNLISPVFLSSSKFRNKYVGRLIAVVETCSRKVIVK